MSVSNNDLSSSLRYGISIKGQDVSISCNEITNNGDVGIDIDRHVIDTKRVTILFNNISGNMNYGVKVTASVTEIINAEHNWWGDASGPFHPTSNSGAIGDAVSDGVDFDPWLSAPVGDVCPPPPVIEVDIDIKPGSDPNSINFGSKGVVPVAVLTTDDFDASTINPETVSFAGASPVRWAMEDVDGDGDMDMLFHFDTQALNLDASSTEATLTGNTTDGTPIQGTDTVNTVPKG